MSMLIDSHAHLSTEKLQPDLEKILERAQQAGIEAIVNICTDPEELERGIALAGRYSWIYTVASTTPHDAHSHGDSHFAIMAEHARAGNLVAIGETGLEYHYFKERAAEQQELLRRYLRLADACSLPIVIHCRDAFDDLFRILDEEKSVTGVLHCFTGTLEEARGVLARGWYISLSGIVTFNKSVELREVAKEIPLDQLLIETDTPYLAPHPFRSKQNEPALLVKTAECIAKERAMSFENLAAATTLNARSFFRL